MTCVLLLYKVWCLFNMAHSVSMNAYMVGACYMNFKLGGYKYGLNKLLYNDFAELCWNDLSADEQDFFELIAENYMETDVCEKHEDGIGIYPNRDDFVVSAFYDSREQDEADVILKTDFFTVSVKEQEENRQ